MELKYPKCENGTPYPRQLQEMEHLSSAMEHQTEWRRDKVQELCSKGYSQREISQILKVLNGTVNRDISYLRNLSIAKEVGVDDLLLAEIKL